MSGEGRSESPSSSVMLLEKAEMTGRLESPPCATTAKGAVSMTEPAKLLLLASLLANDRIITNNGKAFLKELILCGDPRLLQLLRQFESSSMDLEDHSFLRALVGLIEETQEAAFNAIFRYCSLEDGKVLSKSEREKFSLQDDKSLIYGEVEFRSFNRVLRKISPGIGGVFYDLGSGTGRALFVARLTHDFSRCVGIEVLSSLHHAAQSIIHRFNAVGGLREYLNTTQPQEVEVQLGSFLDGSCPTHGTDTHAHDAHTHTCVDWSDGDIVFANSTCFDDQVVAGIAKKASLLKPGAYVITFTKGLESDDFEVLEKKRYKMSWGPATVFIHRRLNHDGTPFRDVNERVERGTVNGLSVYFDGDDDSYTDEEEEEDELDMYDSGGDDDLEEEEDECDEEEEGEDEEDGDDDDSDDDDDGDEDGDGEEGGDIHAGGEEEEGEEDSRVLQEGEREDQQHQGLHAEAAMEDMAGSRDVGLQTFLSHSPTTASVSTNTDTRAHTHSVAQTDISTPFDGVTGKQGALNGSQGERQ